MRAAAVLSAPGISALALAGPALAGRALAGPVLTVLVLAGLVLLAGGLARAVLRRRFLIVTVRGGSMMPAYRDGDRVLVRRGRRYRVGDVVVFRSPYPSDVELLLKRVLADEGDPVPEEFRPAVGLPAVPLGHLLVRGDAVRSQDSRHFGALRGDQVLGVARRPPRSPHRPATAHPAPPR